VLRGESPLQSALRNGPNPEIGQFTQVGKALPARLAPAAACSTTAAWTWAVTASTSAAESSTASCAAATFSLWPGFVDGQGSSMQILAINAVDCPVSLFGVCHFHKREASRLAGIAIPDQVDAINLPELPKERFEVTFSSRER
jgi:hypothetical protein